ncbi:MAG TPA: lysylphosphatidylglycerol synthase transmembrane domain-containing protein [Anaerolineales bacterium]|jgi:uncharacterized protein (TIRG00374 family)|nr:lysylphosphatidylglycerol synthase transmembrane domain-containing protein [Anaerolineales bacterium]
MTELNQPAEAKNTFLRILPGIVVSGIAIVILLSQIDLGQTVEEFQKVKLNRILIATLILVVAFITRAMGWRVLLQEKVSLKLAFSAETIGYLLNTLLPFRLGELGRALVLGIRSPLSFWEAFPTVVVERIFDLGFMAGLLLGTLPFVVGADWATTAAVVAAVLFVMGFAVLYLMVLNPDWVQKLFGTLAGRWPRLKAFGGDKIDLFLRGLAVLRSPKRFLLFFFWIAMTWVLSVAWNSIVLTTFYPSPSFIEAGFVVGVAAIGVAAPSTQGNLGVYEAAIVSAFVALSADPANGLAHGLVTHGLYLLVVVALGFISLAREKISIREVYSLAQNRQTLSE